MITNANQDKKSKSRELEIARRFRQIIDGLPVIALHNLLTNLCDAVEQFNNPEPNTKSQTSKRRWTQSEGQSIQFPSPVEVAVEVLPSSGDNQDRFDLVVPIPPVTLRTKLVTSLIFEFKLGERDKGQLKRYSRLAPSSVVVSISVDDAGSGELIEEAPDEDNVHRWWIHQTWEHVYFALQSMLSGDAEPRIVTIDEPDDLALKLDHRIAGQDRLAFSVESFLTLLIERNLLPNRSLTLVVPMGNHAVHSLNFRNLNNVKQPYYAHPDTWKAGYRYLVAIKNNTVQAIYSVDDSVTTGLVLPEPPAGLDPKEWNRLCEDQSLRVSMLKSLNADQNYAHYLGKTYVSVGPAGRNRTFTQTHRYLERLDDIGNYFKVEA